MHKTLIYCREEFWKRLKVAENKFFLGVKTNNNEIINMTLKPRGPERWALLYFQFSLFYKDNY